jgi:hypothetical protein
VWQAIFFVGLVAVLVMAFKDPVWLVCAGAYVYFAIPHVEFKVPAAPYQAGFFGLAFLSSFFYYALFHKWGAQEIHQQALKAGQAAIDAAREAMKEALSLAVVQDKLPGEIRQAAVTAGEAIALDVVSKVTPSALYIPVRRAVQTTMATAADQAEQEILKIMNLAWGSTKGNLRVAVQERAMPILDESLNKTLPAVINKNVDDAIKADQAFAATQSASRGPLGIPMPQGPIGGLLTNPGLWLHVIFVILTYFGARNAVYSYENAAPRVMVAVLLLIPLSAILLSVRTAHHFRIFVYAWMFGTWHICMNGVSYWLQYGGRADNAGGQGGEANFLGAIIVTVTPIAFGLAINAKHFLERMAFLGVAGCYALGVLASGSRAGLLAMIGGLGYWLMNTTRRGMAIGLFMMAASGFLVAAPESFWEKMGTILGPKDTNPWVQGQVEPSKGERLVLWALAMRLWREHPVWGIGPLNYPVVSAEETDFTDPYQGQRGLQTHNTWLQLLAEYGVVGAMVWGGAFLLSTYCYRRARRRLRDYPGWEWYGALCLGLESGSISSAIVLSFNSFQWYDYIYWHMIVGPLALEIARRTGDRLDWMKPVETKEQRPPPRWGAPARSKGIALGEIDLAEQAPLSVGSRHG